MCPLCLAPNVMYFKCVAEDSRLNCVLSIYRVFACYILHRKDLLAKNSLLQDSITWNNCNIFLAVTYF